MASYSNPYKFSAYSTAAQNTGNVAFAKVTFLTEEFDTSGNYATDTFTAPIAGFYHFDARVGTSGTGGTFILSLFKNGTEFKRGTDERIATQALSGIISVTVQLAASDTIDIRSYGNAAIAIDVTQPTCYFTGFLVSAT